MGKNPERNQIATSEESGDRGVLNELTQVTFIPDTVRTYLLQAEEGDLNAQAELFERMRERDGALDAHLRTRSAGVASLPWQIDAADDSAEAEAAAEFAREAVGAIPDIQQSIKDLLDAVPQGFATQEIRWATGPEQWAIKQLDYVPQRWWEVDENDGTTLLLRQQDGTSFEPNPLNFITHRAQARSGFVARTSLLRSCVRAFLVRHYAWKDMMAFAEIYGIPIRVGVVAEGIPWTDPEVTNLRNAVRNMGSDMWALMRDGNAINIIGAGSTGDGSIFERAIDMAGLEMTLAILGQTLTSGGEGGGSRALGQVHNLIRRDLLEDDAHGLEDTLSEQLLAPLVALNISPDAPMPRWNFLIPDAKDRLELADIILKAREAGMEVGKKWAHEELGIPEPEEGEEVLPPAPAPVAPVQEAGFQRSYLRREDLERLGESGRAAGGVPSPGDGMAVRAARRYHRSVGEPESGR